MFVVCASVVCASVVCALVFWSCSLICRYVFCVESFDVFVQLFRIIRMRSVESGLPSSQRVFRDVKFACERRTTNADFFTKFFDVRTEASHLGNSCFIHFA